MGLADSRQIQTYSFPGFRGLNLKDGPITVPPQYAREANFVTFGLLGTIEKSKAPGKFNGIQITSNPAILAMSDYHQVAGTSFFVVYTSNGKFYKISVSGVVTDITPSNVTIATNKYGHFFVYNNLLWYSDGVNEPIYVHDTVTSSDWYELGLTAPDTGATAATGAAGNLTGTNIQYKFIFVSDTGTLSNASPASNKVSPSSEQVDLSNVMVNADTAENTVKRYIYRNVLEDDPAFYFVGEIDDNTTTDFNDNVPDTDLAERFIEEKEKLPKGTWGFTEYHGSIYGFVPRTSNLLFSGINDAEAWGAFNTEPILPGDGHSISALGKLQNLVVFKTGSIHNWIGYPGLFRREQKVANIGCVSHRTVANVDLPSGGEVLFFLSQHGPRFYDEQDSFLVSRELEPIFTGTDPNYKFNHAKADQASAIYSPNERLYMLSIPINSSSTNNLLMIYDVYANSWNIRSPLYAGSITTKTDTNTQDVAVIGESRSDATDGGWVSILTDQNDYYANDYTGEYQTAWNHFGSPNHVKLLRFIEVDAEAAGTYNLLIDFYIDGSQVPVITVPMSLSEEGFAWDAATAIWDTATWSKDAFITKILSLKKVQGRYISVGFRTDTKDRPWKVLQVRVQYQLLSNAGDRR
jgi:hypothetical protein